jgi:general secretion pathway protein I
MSTRAPEAGQDGFTLIEAIVAAAIAAVALAALLDAFSLGLAASARIESRDRATLVAESVLESLGSSEMLAEGETRGRSPDGFDWRAMVRPRDDLVRSDPASVLVRPLEVDVEVGWREGARRKEVALRTIRLEARR